MPVLAPRRLFTVREFHQMADAAIFGDDDRLELLRGDIIQMTPIGSRHAACVSRLNRFLGQSIGDQFIVRVQDPVRLNDYSEPQPDLAVVKARDDFYRDRHPGPAEVLLVIEVADTSAEIDRTDKALLYAQSGIPELWVVDLTATTVHVYREPAASGYSIHETLNPGRSLPSIVMPSVQLRVDDVLN